MKNVSQQNLRNQWQCKDKKSERDRGWRGSESIIRKAHLSIIIKA